MKTLFQHPLFIAGLVIRLAIILCLLPQMESLYYLPFLQSSIEHFSLDPWQSFLDTGGSPLAFPYGYGMWLFFLPGTFFATVLGVDPHYGYGLTLLAADIGLLSVLSRLWTSSHKLLLGIYWLSPIIILASYVLGFNDLVPVLLLMIAIYFLKNLHFHRAGMLCGLAVSAKLSMVMAVPFFLIYLYCSAALRHKTRDYLVGLGLSAALVLLPFAFSEAGMHMISSNPEMRKIYQVTLELGPNVTVYLLPLAYLLMLYGTWRIRRLNFSLFHAVMGLSFLLVVLLTPASSGWFVWVVPFLVLSQASGNILSIALVGAFSLVYVIDSLLRTTLMPSFYSLPMQPPLLAHTFLTAIGLVLALRIWREAIYRNRYFRLSRKPFVIGIAGDSGAGKDTLADSLTGLFGSHSVAAISGDDYHLWDRQKPMWQSMTHLNPRANDLEKFGNDLANLVSGKAVFSRHYDHATGKMSHPMRIKPNDFIIASGLHALYLPAFREAYNLTIYLAIDEQLRRALKIHRDIYKRGHTMQKVLASLERREPDSEQFIRPQMHHADLVMSLLPVNPNSLVEDVAQGKPLRLKLHVRSRTGFHEPLLTRILIGICGLHVTTDAQRETVETVMTIEGDCSAEDIRLAASILLPQVSDFLDVVPNWQAGSIGLMQLIALFHINQALHKRLLW